ncbi:MAG TPA: Flp pilus assembly protein CpaB [Gemmataceae bacterium]|nr:Flp pilus assembly protein CpaB [Gemmataceae bacterium]
MSTRTILIIILALIFGVSAAVGVNLFARQGATTADRVSIVVAASDVSRGGTLTASQLKLVDCANDLVPPGALTSLEDAQDRLVLSPLVKDEPVIEGKLGAKNARGGLAGLIPPGMRAFTIQTPNIASGVAGFVLPGNKVDVLLTMNGDDRTGGGITTTLLQNIEIMAVDHLLDAPSERKADGRNLQSVTLLVTPDQAAKLDLGQNRGSLHLSLRNPEDSVAANTRPATLNSLQFYQDKPWGQQALEVLDALKKRTRTARPGGPQAVEAGPRESPTAQAGPALEIRTLRGRYYGAVPVEAYAGSAAMPGQR